MKQAKHYAPSNESNLMRIMVCPLGGFVARTQSGSRDPFDEGGCEAAFTSADECAEWVKSWLKNVTARQFGARKAELKK